MSDKKTSRLRRARRGRAKISELGASRLVRQSHPSSYLCTNHRR